MLLGWLTAEATWGILIEPIDGLSILLKSISIGVIPIEAICPHVHVWIDE